MAKWLQKVVGESFGNRQSVLATLSGGELVELKCEPDNPYDKNAVAALTSSGEIGYIPKEEAARFSRDITRGIPHRAWIYRIHGGGEGYSFGAVLLVHSADDVSDEPDFTEQNSVSYNEEASGCLGMLFLSAFFGSSFTFWPDIFI